MLRLEFAKVFLPDTPPAEIIIHGSVLYLSIFLMLRLVLKRHSGNVNTNDLLVLVLISDAAQNGMAGQYQATALSWSPPLFSGAFSSTGWATASGSSSA